MKKIYTNPEIELNLFALDDVMVVSGTLLSKDDEITEDGAKWGWV